MAAVLEINDHQITLTNVSNDQITQSCGYATIAQAKSGKELLLGNDAKAQARRQPRISYNQYWNQLNLEPIETGKPKLRHHADFVHQQLLDLHQQNPFDQVILSLPASFSHEQIGLLLGICQQCPFEVIGIIDSALAAIANQTTQSSNDHLYLDIQLHQCILSKIHLNEQAKVLSTDIISGSGIIQLFQRFAHTLTQEFISQCRFDPMHDADSEQQLYDLLDGLITSEQDEEPQLNLDGKQVTLNRQTLIRQTSQLFNHVIEAINNSQTNGYIYISQRVAAISELMQPLKHHFANRLITIEANSVAKTCVKLQQQICDHPQGLVFTNQLKREQLVDTTVKTIATHLLFDHSAYTLSEQAWYLNLTAGKLSLSTNQTNAIAAVIKNTKDNAIKLQVLGEVYVNGIRAKDIQTLNYRDTIAASANQTANESVTLINVISHNEQTRGSL